MRKSTKRTQRTNNSSAFTIATWFGFTNRAWITSGPAVMPTPTPASAMNLCAVEISRRDAQIHGGCDSPVHLGLYVMLHGHSDQAHRDNHDHVPNRDGINGLLST